MGSDKKKERAVDLISKLGDEDTKKYIGRYIMATDQDKAKMVGIDIQEDRDWKRKVKKNDWLLQKKLHRLGK